MATIVITRKGWTAKYSGGPYIDLCLNGHVVDCIGVFDYKKGEPQIDLDKRAVIAELEAWLEENADNLDAYREHVRYL